MAAKKGKVKNIKTQRWAVIMAAVLAVGMVLSLVGTFIVQSINSKKHLAADQHVAADEGPGPEEYLAHYSAEAERLDDYLATNEPTEAILLEQVNNYRYLGFIQQVFFEDEEAFAESQQAVLGYLSGLVEMVPENAAYRYEYIDALVKTEAGEEAFRAETGTLLAQLHEEPNPRVHLALVDLLSSTGEEELVEKEIHWLEDLLYEAHASGEADSEENFFYAYLAAEYLDKEADALVILKNILAEESEDSYIYQDAAGYLEHLETESF